MWNMTIDIPKSDSRTDFYRRQEWHRWLYDRLGDSYDDWFIYDINYTFRIFIADDADALAFKLKFGL
jgi:hypothetical protein